MKNYFSVFFIFINITVGFSQTTENSEGVTVLKKANPQTNKEITQSPDAIITTDKMKNPAKKEEKNEQVNDAVYITDQKQKNPKNPK